MTDHPPLEYEPAYYAELAARENREAFRNRLSYLRAMLDDIQFEGATILDIGAGIGGVLKFLHREYPAITKLIGTDSAGAAVRMAQEHLTPEEARIIEFRLATADRQPCEDGECDLVICTELIEHLVDPTPLLREIRRVLKPGGWLFMTTAPNRVSLSWGFARLRGATMEKDHHVVLYSPWSLRRVLRRAGFTIFLPQAHQIYMLTQFHSSLRAVDTVLERLFDRLPNRLQWLFANRMFFLAKN